MLRELPDDSLLHDQWNRLVFALEQPEVFYTHEWALAVQRAYSGFLQPLIVLAYEESSLVGVVALAIESGNQQTTFLCSTTADYCDFLSHPDFRLPFVDAVFSELNNLQIKKLLLANVPAESRTTKAIESSAAKHGYYLWRRPAYGSARVMLQSTEQRAKTKELVQRKKVLHRSLNGLARQGPVQLNHARTWDKLRSELPDFAKAHVGRFLSMGRVSNLVRPERRHFLEELARLLSASGWLCVSRLMTGNTAVAWNYGFQFAGSWFWYQPTLNSKFEKNSPGFCLLSKIILEACQRPDLKLIDLGLGEENYKERFSTGTRHTLHITVTQSRVEQLMAASRYCAARLAKASPALERCVRSLLGRLVRTRELLRKSRASGLARWALGRIWNRLFASDEVFFYKWPRAVPQVSTSGTKSIRPIDLELLASAAIQYANDSQTVTYLLRCAPRLHCKDQWGFALTDEAGIPLHFAWVAPLEGFKLSELNLKMPPCSAESVLLFDCWTPNPVRGRGFYPMAISRIATKLLTEGKSPWIFSAATNRRSVVGIEKSGFRRHYSLVRRKLLLWQKIKTQEISERPFPTVEVSVTA